MIFFPWAPNGVPSGGSLPYFSHHTNTFVACHPVLSSPAPWATWKSSLSRCSITNTSPWSLNKHSWSSCGPRWCRGWYQNMRKEIVTFRSQSPSVTNFSPLRLKMRNRGKVVSFSESPLYPFFKLPLTLEFCPSPTPFLKCSMSSLNKDYKK